MFSTAKNALKKLPGINRILAQRNALLEERDRLLADLVSLRRSREEVHTELVEVRDRSEHRLNELQWGFATLREQLQTRLATAEARRDELQHQLDTLQQSWNDLRAELTALHERAGRTQSALVAATQELDDLKRNIPGAPPGHFYSPIPSIDEVRPLEDKVLASVPREVAGVDMREKDQLALLRDFLPYYREMPFKAQRADGLRYYFDNPSYSYSDAILLHCMIRHLRPRRIIEIGSGFSSCVLLDTNDLCFDGSIALTFVEPYPDLLLSVIRETDKASTRRIESPLQDVDLAEFDALEANDILFIDSTHVSKIGSDVNRIFFDILPRLRPGVHVHFHDIFFPFEYPKAWIYEGRAWNEAYLLRVFLQFNNAWRVVLMNTFVQRFNRPFFEREMPLCLENTGASVWIRKEAAT